MGSSASGPDQATVEVLARASVISRFGWGRIDFQVHSKWLLVGFRFLGEEGWLTALVPPWPLA